MIPQDSSLDASTYRRRDPTEVSDSSTNVPSSPPAADSFRFSCSAVASSSSSSSAFLSFRSGADIRGRRGTDGCVTRRRRQTLVGRSRRQHRRQPTRNCSVKDLQPSEEPAMATVEMASPVSADVLALTKSASRESCAEDVLPLDPRQWSREDVQLWLRQMSVDYDNVIATPDYVITDRFPMNGRGLCLMARKPEMFETRVPCGGLLLFNDFRSRLLRAVTSSIGDTRTMAAPTVA